MFCALFRLFLYCSILGKASSMIPAWFPLNEKQYSIGTELVTYLLIKKGIQCYWFFQFSCMAVKPGWKPQKMVNTWQNLVLFKKIATELICFCCVNIWPSYSIHMRKVWGAHTWGHEKKSVWIGDGYQEVRLESFSCKPIPSPLSQCPQRYAHFQHTFLIIFGSLNIMQT